MSMYSKLSHITKLTILLATIIVTELGSNIGLYFVILIWLEIDQVVVKEQGILDYFSKLKVN